ncbi:PARP catalytic domain-containing protein [Mycena kentingensis (nom. inval.)]|nr:PARP catalytic domain-containing protein [Mycena kentingensis (nom. inval.)]
MLTLAKQQEIIEILDSDEEAATPPPPTVRRNRPATKPAQRKSPVIDLTSDDDVAKEAPRPSSKTVTVPPSRSPFRFLENLDSDSDDENDPLRRDLLRMKRYREEARLTKQEQTDAEYAQKLADREEAELSKVLEAVNIRREGIVFRVAVDVATGLLDDGTPAHHDDIARFQPWRQLLAGVKLKKFHWIVNYELERKFEAARDKLRVLTGKEPEELQMFHGTPSQNIDSILAGGFRIGGTDGHRITHGAALGYGIYLAPHAPTSMSYCAGGNRLFACRVLAGRISQDRAFTMTLPSAAVGSGIAETFSGNTGVLVVRHTDLVLPCYMIEWDATVPWNVGVLPQIARPATPPLVV